MKLKAALQSMRLRTLPLSTAGVLLGILLSVADWHVDLWTAVLIVLTTVCLQILSNLSNELGDVLRGTDTEARQGPEYGLNSGAMTLAGMKRLIGLFVVLCVVFGTAMTWRAFGTLWDLTPILILMLGACFVCTRGQGLHWKLLLPASAVGFFSVGVLNVNNIRDMKTDAATRVTVALKLGIRRARIYQTVLIGLGWACMTAYCLLCWPSVWHWLWVLTLPLYIKHLRMVWTRSDRDLDPALPLLAISTFLLCLLMGIGFCLYLI